MTLEPIFAQSAAQKSFAPWKGGTPGLPRQGLLSRRKSLNVTQPMWRDAFRNWSRFALIVHGPKRSATLSNTPVCSSGKELIFRIFRPLAPARFTHDRV
jgi:hypothetical protein